MSSNTKAFEEKMKSAVEHLERELKTVRAGRANPGVLDKVTVDYSALPPPSSRWLLWLSVRPAP